MDKRNRPYVFSVIGLAAVVVHFIVILSAIAFEFNDELDLVEVEGPIARGIEHEAWDYMHPLFTQNWFLFAPEPVSYREIIEVKGYYSDDRQSETMETAWLSINEAIRNGIRRNRFSALNFLRNSHSQTIDPLQWQFEYVNGAMRLDRRLAASSEEAEAFRPIERYASYFLQREYPGIRFASMDVRIAIVFPPGFGTDEPTYPEESIHIANLAFVPSGRG